MTQSEKQSELQALITASKNEMPESGVTDIWTNAETAYERLDNIDNDLSDEQYKLKNACYSLRLVCRRLEAERHILDNAVDQLAAMTARAEQAERERDVAIESISGCPDDLQWRNNHCNEFHGEDCCKNCKRTYIYGISGGQGLTQMGGVVHGWQCRGVDRQSG